MSVGPAEILIILVVALLVFGPQRLPEVARQVGSAMRELRKMQDTVRGELDMVLHPEHGTSSSPVAEVEPADHTTVDADVAGTTDDAPDDAPDPSPHDQSAGNGGFSGPSDSFI
jgi:sec-independent protein translocase protein TatA